MMEWLWVPNAKLDEIESQHPHLSDRLREVFSYFLRVDPDASWRSVLKSLDAVEETKLVDRLRQLAEPVTGTYVTVCVNALCWHACRHLHYPAMQCRIID